MSVVLLLAVAFSLLPEWAGAGSVTYVTHDCLHVKREPAKIMFACADGGYYVDHLRWGYWYPKKARARGIFHFNDCDPTCAGGTFHTRRGTLRLRYRLWCPDIHKYVFRHAWATYDRPWDGRSGEDFKLYCPLT